MARCDVCCLIVLAGLSAGCREFSVSSADGAQDGARDPAVGQAGSVPRRGGLEDAERDSQGIHVPMPAAGSGGSRAQRRDEIRLVAAGRWSAEDAAVPDGAGGAASLAADGGRELLDAAATAPAADGVSDSGSAAGSAAELGGGAASTGGFAGAAPEPGSLLCQHEICPARPGGGYFSPVNCCTTHGECGTAINGGPCRAQTP